MQSFDPTSCGLPHREPFVFIDKVIEISPGEKAVAVKTFPAEEPFFRGHFPGDPIVPGVILTEALAQTAGIAAGAGTKCGYRLSAIKMMKFLKRVLPNQEVIFEARQSGSISGLHQFQVVAKVEGKVVAEGVVILNEC